MAFTLLASLFTTCLTFLVSTQLAQCTASCRRPRTPFNGNFTSSNIYGFPVGTVVKFTCHDGYTLKGAIKIICQSNGQWSDKTPLCIRKAGGECEDAPSINHGSLTGSNNYPQVGSTVSYVCYTGYKLVGIRTRTCQINRQWSGNAPVCVRISCNLPAFPQHGSIQYSTLMYGDVIKYTCDSPCWVLSGQETRRCTEYGTWSGYAPTCLQSGCTKFGDIDNGQVDYYHNNVPIYTFHECVQVGVKAIFSCADNFHLASGSSIRACLPSGTWSGSGHPVCDANTCDNPPNIFNGKWTRCSSFKSNSVGSCVRYTCQPNYYLWGAATLVCTSAPHIHWDNVPPQCLTLTQYSKQCTASGDDFYWDKERGIPSCIMAGDRDADSSIQGRAEVGTLTIVTATAGSIFGILVVLLFVVTCQRRRNHNYLRRLRRRSRRSFDDHCSLIAYSGEVHFVLPSYDEAITQEEREPPSFESAVGTGASSEQEESAQRTNSSEQTQSNNTESEENATDLPVTRSEANQVVESDNVSQCTVTNNPVYEEIGCTVQENGQDPRPEVQDHEPGTLLEPAELGGMGIWSLLA